MNRYCHQQGFTLLEIMTATTIAAVLMGCILTFMIQGNIMLQTSKQENELQQSLAIGMDKITRELLTGDQLRFADNQLGYQPDKDDRVLTFICDKNLVRYYVDQQRELSRSYRGVGLPIASHVKYLRIEYFDVNGEQISAGTPAGSVVRVKIQLIGSMPGIKDTTLTSAVTLRTANP
ncbi:prepilin-type N-terminal cleavage/methylation domain-containing protein [Peptococcaceae bacterium 1198_IL3148]